MRIYAKLTLVTIVTRRMSAKAQQGKFQPLPFIINLGITLGIAAVASYFTIKEIPGWYSTLHKPSFNPPNQLFGPVWTVLYILIAIAAYLVWRHRAESDSYHTARLIYFVQLLLNFSWSIVFFGQHQILWALVVIILLWLSILANMYYFSKFSRIACWLLLPYLLWVSFATTLNFSIYLLNH
ncbi:TspO/MBR family protein [Mucilaginibacter boryungensis]|nr:TspO/MBR family protein [Mucilaginibacter boryungensis]